MPHRIGRNARKLGPAFSAASLPGFAALAGAILLCAASASAQIYARPFSPASVWNTPLPDPPVLSANSAEMIQYSMSFGGSDSRLHVSLSSYSVPIYYATGATDTYNVPVQYPWPPYNVPGPNFGANVPIPPEAQPATGSDGHMVVVDIERMRCWDFFQAVKTPGGWTATYGIGWDLSGPGYNPVWTASARAAGTPLVAGLITYAEIQAGYIPHALALSFPLLRDQTVFVRPPASASQSGSVDPEAIPMGSRIQLDPALDLNAYGLTAPARIVARALQEYGGYVVDSSQANVVYAEDLQHDPARKWTGILSSSSLTLIPHTSFRVIDPASIGASTTTATRTPTNTRTPTPTSTPIETPTPITLPSEYATPVPGTGVGEWTRFSSIQGGKSGPAR